MNSAQNDELKTNQDNDKKALQSLLQKSPKTRIKKLYWVFVLIVVIALGYGLKIWLFPQQSSAPIYQTSKVKIGDIRATVSATGTLQPTNKVEVGSELSGTVEKVLVDYNDKVTKGQLLAVLNTDKLQAQVLQSKASLQVAEAGVLEAEATLQEADANYARLLEVYKLSAGKAPSKTDLSSAKASQLRAKAAKTTALAKVEQAKANLDQNQTDLAKTKVLSPINGIVLKRSIEAGQTVAATMTAPVLFTLAEDLTSMELEVNVDEADVGQVNQGQTAIFTVDAYPNTRFPAVIKQVRFGAETLDGVVTYATLLSVSNKDLKLRPGMTASADILVKEKKNVLLIPMAALRFTPDLVSAKQKQTSIMQSLMPRPRRSNQNLVKSKNKDGTETVWKMVNNELKPVSITLGDSNGSSIEVLKGDLHKGDEIIIGVEVPTK